MLKNLLKENERLDDLQLKELKIIQNPDKYCFTSDSVLLSSFAKVKKGETVCDFCSGSGIIAILLAAKNEGVKKIYGIEIQEYLSNMAKRSVQLNGFAEKIEIINMPLQQAYTVLGYNSTDVIVCNPPYSVQHFAMTGENKEIAIARHEISINLKEIIEQAKKLLKFKGRLYIVHQAERAAEIIYEMINCNIMPKTMRSVQARADKEPHLVLIEGVYGAKSGLKWLKPLYILNEKNEYTDEAKKIYSME